MKHRRAWLVPALIALVLFLGGVASNLVAADLQAAVGSFKIWVWVLFFVALVVAVGAAVWESRQRETERPNLRRVADEYSDLRRSYLERLCLRLEFLPLRGVDFKTASAETGEKQRLRTSVY